METCAVRRTGLAVKVLTRCSEKLGVFFYCLAVLQEPEIMRERSKTGCYGFISFLVEEKSQKTEAGLSLKGLQALRDVPPQMCLGISFQ